MENNLDQMSHKDRILELIRRKVPELTDIYQGTLTIFYRMLLWNYIEKVNWVDKSQWSSASAIQKCFDSFIQEVDRVISEEVDPMMKMEIECFKSKMLNGQFKSCPENFIEEMATMMHKENDLIKQYFFHQLKMPIQDSLETLNDARKDSGDTLMDELKKMTEDLNCQLTASSQAEWQVLNISGVHSPEGQQRMHKMKAQCIQIGQDCDANFTSFFSKMEEVKKHLKEVKRLFQKKLSFDSIDLPMSETVLSLQALDSNFEMWTSALCSVKEDIKQYENDVIQMCTKHPQGVQSDLFSKLHGYKNRLSQFLSDYCHMCVLTIKCPGSQHHKSSSSSSKKEEEKTEAPKKKASKSKMDKKENSLLNSTLKILGAQSFGRNFKVDVNNSSVLLVDETLLPEYLPEGTEYKFDQEDIIKCGRLKPESPPQLNDGFELKFYREEIQEPNRPKDKSSKADKEKASLVVASFSRFWYRINVEVYDRHQTLFALSHPIGWRTGSNQLLQFNGSVTWYHWNVPNVYENLRIPQKVPLSRVLAMLDAQVSKIKDQTGGSPSMTECRSLSNSDQEFLKSWLVGENSPSEYVHLKDFICNKASESKKRGCNDPGQKVPTFDFHTWFFALLKSLNGFLKGLWLDGLIYGICSGNTTTELLMKEETDVGTIMLRPSTATVHNTRCMEPRLDLVLDFKTNRGHYDHVESIYWGANQIKYLPEALATHGRTLKYIQGVNNRRSYVEILKNYFTNDRTYVYRSTTFRLKISFEIVSENNDQYDAGSTAVDEKKLKQDNFVHGMDSASCHLPASCTFDNQSAIMPVTLQGEQEMSPGSFDSPLTNQSECNEISLPTSVLELEECSPEAAQFDDSNFVAVGLMYNLL